MKIDVRTVKIKTLVENFDEAKTRFKEFVVSSPTYSLDDKITCYSHKAPYVSTHDDDYNKETVLSLREAEIIARSHGWFPGKKS